uniref:Estradiol 17-beta-dehydrogenase n=1 Tax=Angiostrongylus cantonensis TaxID=6313 RepID=A0A158PAC7_ANGCA
MAPLLRLAMELLPAPWIEMLVMIQVYVFAAVYATKELMFEVINRGIQKRLENDIMKSNAMRSAGAKCVLITGGDGTIGSEVIKRFLHYGYTVHATVGDVRKAVEVFASFGGPKLPLTLYDVDFLTPYEVAMFARGFVNRCSELNIVVMCAGTMLAAPEMEDGISTNTSRSLDLKKGHTDPRMVFGVEVVEAGASGGGEEAPGERCSLTISEQH